MGPMAGPQGENEAHMPSGAWAWGSTTRWGTLLGRERHSGDLRGHPGVIMRVREAGDQDGREQGQRRVVAT